MPCINPDGTMEPVARAILLVLRTPGSPEEVARQVSLPLYRIRSGLRELAESGLVVEREGTYALTAAGQERVDHQGGSTQGPAPPS